MKALYNTVFYIFCCMFLQLAAGCEKEPVFGNDRAVSGTMKDKTGNIIAGDITTTDLIVKALGAGDVVTTDMRVAGDGTFGNNKLYARKYKVWVSGPVTTEDTLNVDLAAEKAVVHDFIVNPFILINTPVVSGNLTANTVDIQYGMTAQGGRTVTKRELYCSTNPFPNAIIGSGYGYTTIKVTLTGDAGTATVAGLVTKTKYYIRIGAQTSDGKGSNYSEQITITTL
ncbi:MAG: DUF3823 domain-containing protein [Chitinophagaceae bacterium]|nr:DUF3823 domain-containing protein [Chitinophagaceae bacterium]